MNKDLATRLRAKEAALHDDWGSQAPEYGKGLLDAADEAEKTMTNNHPDAALRKEVAWVAKQLRRKQSSETAHLIGRLEAALNAPAAAVCDRGGPCDPRPINPDECSKHGVTVMRKGRWEYEAGKYEAAE